MSDMKIEEAVVCKCVECKRGVATSVATCADTACALHAFRLWEPESVKPKKRTQSLSDAERERRRAQGKRLAERRWGKKTA